MVNFEEGTLIKGAYVLINGVEYPVIMPEYSGNTPLSKENMNKLQQDLYDTIEESNTKIYEHEYYSLTTAITSGSWQKVQNSNYETTLPKGKYLILLGVAVSGSSNGLLTLRPFINGAEERTSVRQSMPISSLFTSTQIATVKEYNEETPITINAQVYANASCTVQNFDIKIIQL